MKWHTQRRDNQLFLWIELRSSHFVFFWRPEETAEMLRQLGKLASCPEINFTWYDAAMIAPKVRQCKAENIGIA